LANPVNECNGDVSIVADLLSFLREDKADLPGLLPVCRRLGNYRGTESMVDISRGVARHLKAWAEEVKGPALHASTVMSAI
jgi:hypothetical protein